MRHTPKFPFIAALSLIVCGTVPLTATTELSLATGGKTIILADNAGGPVLAVSLTAAGAGYTSVPTVKIVGGGGTGATAKATINAATHKITAITLLTAGSGYTSNPTVSITGGGGTGGGATASAAFDANPAHGQVTFIGAFGVWKLNVTTGTAGFSPQLDLSSVNSCGSATTACNGTGANALTMAFTSTGFEGPVDHFTSSIGGTLAVGHSLTYQGYEDDTNAAFGTQHKIGSSLSFTRPPSAFSGETKGGDVIGAHHYSLTEIVKLSATRAGSSSFDAGIEATVPEPSSLFLLGGLLLLGAVARRNKAACYAPNRR